SVGGAGVDRLRSVVGRSEHTEHLTRFTGHGIAAAFSFSAFAKPANQETDIYPSFLSQGRGERHCNSCKNWQPTLEHAHGSGRSTSQQVLFPARVLVLSIRDGDQNITPVRAIWASRASALSSRDFCSRLTIAALLVRSGGESACSYSVKITWRRNADTGV